MVGLDLLLETDGQWWILIRWAMVRVYLLSSPVFPSGFSSHGTSVAYVCDIGRW